MKFTQSLISLALATAALAAPTPTTIEERSTTMCGQYDTLQTGSFTLYGNKWGISGYTGSQCTTFNSLTSGSIAWSTSWSWAGGSTQVKSYANAGLTFTHKKVSAITSIPTTWKWSNTGTSVVADVSYDLFSSSTGSGTADYEVMIWVAALGGAGPISAAGKAIATPTIGGNSWKLYYGLNEDTKVYSFVATSPIYSFSSDLLLFLTYLVNNQGYPSSQILTTVQAGTEPFTGSSVVFTTSAYTAAVN